jgi:hypothetical protein
MRNSAIVALALLALPAIASASPFKTAVGDPALAQIRGGFTLPGGLEVRLGIDTQTRIDGQLVLQSTFKIDQGPPRFVVQARNAAGDLMPTEIRVEQSVIAKDGVLTLTRAGANTRLLLDGQQTDVTHLIEGGTGSIVTNIADNRAIDVVTTIGLQIDNAQPELLGSSLLRVETLALDATAAMVR